MLTIQVSNNYRSVEKTLELYLQDLNVMIDKDNKNDSYQFKISVNNTSEENLIRIMSDAIEEIIVSYFLDNLIIKRIREIYQHEWIDIDEKLINKVKNDIIGSNLYLDEKLIIKEELKGYLSRNQFIDIDGYILFRLKDYMYILDISIDKVVSIVLEERRLEDLYGMMQYLIENRPAKEKVVNIILKNNDFSLKNAENMEIRSDLIKKVEQKLSGDFFTKADILVTILIIIAPELLIIHFKQGENSQLIKSISELFKGKIVLCNGCNICNINSKID